MGIVRLLGLWLWLFTALAVPTLATAGLVSPPPNFPGTYYFSGTCTDCGNGQTPASAKLVIGSTYANSTFEYDSLKLGHIVATTIFNISLGTAPITGGVEDVTITFLVDLPALNSTSPSASPILTQQEFVTDVNGDWTLGIGPALHNDIGINGTWSLTPIPEPQTLALWLLGLAAVGSVARRKRVLTQPLSNRHR